MKPSGPGSTFLLGDDPEAIEGQRLYVGETDEIRGRLRQHNDSTRGKDFWTRVVIVTSKDDNLTKAHTRYLESRLVTIAGAAKRCTLDNNNAPGTPPLPEADISDMEYFIDQLHIALPVLGLNVLRGAASPAVATGTPDAVSPVFELTIPKRGIAARARQIDGEFTVLEGSTVAGKFRRERGVRRLYQGGLHGIPGTTRQARRGRLDRRVGEHRDGNSRRALPVSVGGGRDRLREIVQRAQGMGVRRRYDVRRLGGQGSLTDLIAYQNRDAVLG